MKSHAVLSLVTFPALLLSISGRAFAQEEQWKIHNFENTRYIEFAFTITENGETKHGTSSLEFEDKGDDKVTVRFKGTLGEMSGEFTTTAPQDEIYGQAMMQMMMTPAAAPMALTVFAPFMPMFFGGRDLSPDAGWTFNDGEHEFSFKVESACSHAGLDGRKIIWRVDGEVRSDACVNPDVPVPLAVTFRTDEGDLYQLEMKKYVSR